MSVVIKCDPVSPSPRGILRVTVPPYKGCTPHLSEIAFVWFSEMADGDGLTAVGEIIQVELEGKECSLALQILRYLPHRRSFGLDDIRDYRNDTTTTVGRLSGKLYKHSLNKVADLNGDEVQLLEEQFG